MTYRNLRLAVITILFYLFIINPSDLSAQQKIGDLSSNARGPSLFSGDDISLGNRLYFNGIEFQDSVEYTKAYYTDGQRINLLDANIFPPDSNSSQAQDWTVFDDKMYFTALTPDSTRDLFYHSPQQRSATKVVDHQTRKDMPLTVYNGSLYYIKWNPSSSQYDLMRHDAGTISSQVVLNVGQKTGYDGLVKNNGKLLFVDGLGQIKETDGTLAGTRTLFQLPSDMQASYFGVSDNSSNFFLTAKYDFSGQPDTFAVVYSNGTPAGTKLLDTISIGSFLHSNHLKGNKGIIKFLYGLYEVNQNGVSRKFFKNDFPTQGYVDYGDIRIGNRQYMTVDSLFLAYDFSIEDTVHLATFGSSELDYAYDDSTLFISSGKANVEFYSYNYKTQKLDTIGLFNSLTGLDELNELYAAGDRLYIEYGNYNVVTQENDPALYMLSGNKVTSIEYTRKKRTTLKVYPNPVSNQVHIEVKEEGKPLDINLVNMNGQRVKSFSRVSRKMNHLNVQGLDAGLYFLVARNQEGELVSKEKLMIQ